ncbi:Nesprin-3 [Galemys pyrenaicus]|uniref:Nesprin-3 n=1 Tax=Galemys pyrenaicus TaxID=202257 RepID=A0A8J6A8K7_GALPY|nr:Nesprin-3 [Galemys pyrenaicus]
MRSRRTATGQQAVESFERGRLASAQSADSLAPKGGPPRGHANSSEARRRGLGSCFWKLCRVALPLQLLLLLLLLLLFLLPAGREGRSCTLANNFARSFRLMLRYHGPPPT